MKQLKTMARSRINDFSEALRAGAYMSMIGQFDVLFDSVYIVSEEVLSQPSATMTKQYNLESQTGGSFTVTRDKFGKRLEQ